MLVAMTIPVVDRMAIIAGRDPVEGRMVVLEHLVGAGDRPRIGALATLADCVAGVHAFEIAIDAVPLTADLAVHLVGEPLAPGTELCATSDLLRRRRAGAVFDVEIRERDRPEHLVATATVTYTFVDGLPSYVPEPHLGDWPSAALATSISDVVPSTLNSSEQLELEINEVTMNAVGVLSGGAMLMGADVAIDQAVRSVTGVPAEVTDLLTYFLAPGRWGPARYVTDCTVQELVGLTRVRVEEAGPTGSFANQISAMVGRSRLLEGGPGDGN